MKWIVVFACMALTGFAVPAAAQTPAKGQTPASRQPPASTRTPSAADLALCPGAVPCPITKPADYLACHGDHKDCCTRFGGIKDPAQDDGTGYVQCKDGEEYPKRASCKCGSP